MKNRLFNLLLFSLIILQLLDVTPLAAAETTPNRIAFAISGGASMGAYESGLIWGMIEVVRQAENTGEWSLGGGLRPIEIASIAGTSAGGINTLLASMVWSVKPENQGGFSNRIDDNIFRDVWLTPDVNRLLPPKADSPQYLPDDALLSRKDLVKVARELRKKWRQPGSFRPGLRIPLGVTVTRVKPEDITISGVRVYNQRFFIPFELHTQADGSATFFFDPEDYPSLKDPAMILMPWSSDNEPFTVSDQQVEDAIMTTSAFPTGFGRKRLEYCRQKALSTGEDSEDEAVSTETPDTGENKWICPAGYELTESEFADGGLFDNLPIGLARELSESSRLHKKMTLPITYLYLDPERQRYEEPVSEDKSACEGENPPEACRELTYNLTSEAAVLGGALGTARKYELYRELTGDNWRLNIPQLTRKIADIIDAETLDAKCASELSYFEGQLGCSDRLRHTGRLLELAYDYHITPVKHPLSAQALLKEGVATTCRPSSASGVLDDGSECVLDIPRLRKQLAGVLVDLPLETLPDGEGLKKDILQSALSIESDRMIQVTSRGGPITGLLLGSFGAFLEYKFREFDYFVGVYDAIITIANNQCALNFPPQDHPGEFAACRDRLSEQLYHFLGVPDNSKSRYIFARMAKREFGKAEGLRFAYDPMPPENRDMKIIYDGLNKSLHASLVKNDDPNDLLATENDFFEYLKAEQFKPTPPADGGKALLALIMDDPEYWSHELVNRASNRLVHLEKQAETIYRAREPDPEKQKEANTTLMGAGALALRTATYKYPRFTFSPSTAPEPWFWRNIIPYEIAFDLVDGDMQLFWQPTWNFKKINAGVRFGFGFTGGILDSTGFEDRGNYGVIGLDFTRIVNTAFFSGWGITPAVYHHWEDPSTDDQTSFGLEAHANLFKNRVRISLGVRDAVHNTDETIFLNLGIADLPGLIYWMTR